MAAPPPPTSLGDKAQPAQRVATPDLVLVVAEACAQEGKNDVKVDPEVERALINRTIDDKGPRSRLDIQRTISYEVRTKTLQEQIKIHIEKVAVRLAEESVRAAIRIALYKHHQAELAQADAALTPEVLAVTTDQLRDAEQRYAAQEDLIRNRSNYEDDLNNIGHRFYTKVISNYEELIHATELGLRECLDEAIADIRQCL